MITFIIGVIVGAGALYFYENKGNGNGDSKKD